MTRLVLVDDHVILREGLGAVLRNAGHEIVGESADPDAAFDIIASTQPDAVLLDINLGGRTGIDLLTRLRDEGQPTPTVMLTMSAAPRHVMQCLRLGALGYVLKGAPASELLLAIDAAIAGKRHVAPELVDAADDVRLETSGGNPFDALSPREREIVLMVVNGGSSAAIGQSLSLSPKTVDTYRSRLSAKLGVGDVPSLVRLAVKHRLIDAD